MTEKAIDARLDEWVNGWIDDATDWVRGLVRARLARSSTVRWTRTNDRSIDDSVLFIHRSIPSRDRSTDGYTDECAPMTRRAPHPSLDAYRQMMHTSNQIDPSIEYIYRQTDTREPPTNPRSTSTSHDDDDARRRRFDARVSSTRRRTRETTEERTLTARLGR